VRRGGPLWIKGLQYDVKLKVVAAQTRELVGRRKRRAAAGYKWKLLSILSLLDRIVAPRPKTLCKSGKKKKEINWFRDFE